MRITIVSLIVISALFYFLLVRDSKSNTKSPPYSGGYCKSIEESKDKGVFEFEVVPCKTDLTLDSGHLLKLKKAWLENAWTSQVYLFGKTRVTKEAWHHLILVYEIIETKRLQNQNVYYFIGGRPVGDSLVHYDCERADTINMPLYRETSPLLPSHKKRVAYDSLAFVRR